MFLSAGRPLVAGNPDKSEFAGSGHQLYHEDFAMLRLDYRVSPADTAYLLFNFDIAYSDAPIVEGGSSLNDRQLITSSRSFHSDVPHDGDINAT